MRFSRIFGAIAAAAVILTACDMDDYNRGERHGTGGEEQKTEGILNERVAGRSVIAYVTYYGNSIPDPKYMTQINYSFAELYVRDNVYQRFAIKGDESRFAKIVNLKRENPALKICISFSHTVSNADNWQDGGFSAMASTEEGRKKFANDCLSFIRKWGIDGIDLDWEFPTISWSGAACSPEDTENYTLLVKQLRETLGPNYLLTYAGYCGSPEGDKRLRFINVADVDPYVDFVNIMTYDIASGSGGQHQSALYKSSMSTYWDMDRTFEEYVKAGIDPSKLVMGIPFYARHDFETGYGIGCVDFRDFDKYYTADKGFKIDNWDDVAKVPYITKDGKMWAGYDNPRSIAIKGEWIIHNGMKGLMYWDYNADDNQGTLRTAVWNAVMQ